MAARYTKPVIYGVAIYSARLCNTHLKEGSNARLRNLCCAVLRREY